MNGTNGTNGTHASNGVAESAARPLNAIVVGAGIGGLTAAIYLRRQGHKVTVLEQSRFANELGAAVHLAPNSNGILKRIGLDAETFGGNEMTLFTDFDQAGNPLKNIDLSEPNKMWQHKWLLVYRVHLHEELKKRASSTDWEGIPVEMRTSSRVTEVDPVTATVTLENGETLQGDFVLGADGVHSRTRTQVPPGDIRPKPSGKSAFRFLIPKQAALDDPVTAQFAQRNGELIIWYGVDRRVVMYPCSNNTMLNFVCIHPVEETQASGEEYNQVAHKEKLLEVYKAFNPALLALLSKAEAESLKVWELLDMDQLPSWTNERLTLLGDAAHPYLPHQGQGAGQAMEDGAALAAVLPYGTLPEEVPERLKLYESFRYERASNIQEFSRMMGRDHGGTGQVDMQRHIAYNFGHDEWDSAVQKFRKWDWARKPNLYWRMPVSFGPMPGPRQRFDGSPRKALHSTFTTASMKFKTSRTLLQNLFPNESFSFISPGSVAYASFSQTTLNKMEWLGGSGYRHFGLYIHGVRYTKKNGEVINGTFMPLLFESLTDPIVSGREELGMPKLYCSIDIYRRSSQYRIQAGWQGAHFGSISLEGLEDVDPKSESGTIGGEADDGILAWKYIPKTFPSRGEAEVEHLTFVPHAEESKVVPSTVHRVQKAAKATVTFDAMDWEALPTLHHVISRLAEIPVYEVMNAKVVEGTGVPDVSAARRED